MYYRYKTKRKRGKVFLKYLFYVILGVTLIVTGYRYRQQLHFWKYSYNKLVENIENAIAVKDTDKRRAELSSMVKVLEQYKNDNSTNPEAFLLAGKVEFHLAETYLPGGFSDMFIQETPLNGIDATAREEFTRAVKDMKKGEALLEGSELKPDAAFTLAMASYFIMYNSNQELLDMLKNADLKNLKKLDHIRFFAVLNILNGKTEQGLNFLMENDRSNESFEGKLFLAVAQRMAKQYTNSIMNFKDLVNKTTDNTMLKLINYNLGLVYFNQSLFKESLVHFENCLKIDSSDVRYKVWMGKNHAALGQGDKAKALWKEVLSSDPAHEEVRKLLGIK